MDYPKIIKQLQLEIEKSKEDIRNLTEAAKPITPDNAIGRLTRMEAINSKNVSDENIRQIQRRLIQLTAAIKRCNDETYGECLICEEEISKKRLESVPEATLCISCATKRNN